MTEIFEDKEVLLSVLTQNKLQAKEHDATPNVGPCMQLVVGDLLGKAQDRFFCILQMNSNLCHWGRLLLDELHTLGLHSCF
jgi:hypothetical protein